MMLISSDFFSPMRTSTSTPRLRKTSSAFGLNSSVMRTLGTVLPLSAWIEFFETSEKCPVEPRSQQLKIALLDGSAAPKAQTWRRGSIRGGIERDALLFEKRSEILGKLGLDSFREGSHTFIDHLEADTGIAANRGIRYQIVDPIGLLDP